MMENIEFDSCKEGLKVFLKVDTLGKDISKELKDIFGMIFREGYKLGNDVLQKETDKKVKELKKRLHLWRKEVCFGNLNIKMKQIPKILKEVFGRDLK